MCLAFKLSCAVFFMRNNVKMPTMGVIDFIAWRYTTPRRDGI